MIPKVRLIFDRKAKAGKADEGDVEVYVYHLGKKRYLSTGVRCRKREYKDGVVSMRADAVELNKRLQWCVRTVQKQVNDMVDSDMFSLERLSLALSDRTGNFLDWVEDVMWQRDVSKSTLHSYKSVIASLRKSGLFNTWGDLTLLNINKYDMFLRGNLATTRRMYHEKLKLFINVAIEHDILKENPYKRFKLPSDKRIHTIRYLTEEDLLKIEGCEAYGSVLKAKEMFLLGCYTGLRYSDIVRISRSNLYSFQGKEWIKGVQQKTSMDYNILLLPEAKRILDRNNWDMNLLCPSLLGYNLKKLAIVAQVNKMLTMHMSRHTFATLALSKGVRIEVVSKMLGHTDIKMTQVYAKVLQQDVAKGFELLSAGSNVK